MAKKICELCGANMSSDMLFGVSLCERCRSAYYDLPTAEAIINDQEFIKNATPQAVKLFTDKIKVAHGKAYAEEKAREEKRKAEQEAFERECREEENRRQQQAYYDDFLKANGHQGYYEYKIITINDNKRGGVNVEEISDQLNSLGRQGWHLRCAYTNELGKNESALGVSGVAFGTNSTMDQSILIMERFIKFQ